jgi:hypothetical protein
MLEFAQHADDSVAEGDEKCAPAEGVWLQSPGWAVSEAEARLGDGAPWCLVYWTAWELAGVDEHSLR